MGAQMTASSLLRNALKVTAAVCLMAGLAACSTSRHHRGQEGAEAAIKVPKVIPPTTEQELKHLPRGLLPDTQNAIHASGDAAPK